MAQGKPDHEPHSFHGVSASALAAACGLVKSADAQTGWLGVPSGVVPGELCVFPKEAYQGWTLAEDLKQAGYLIIGIAPMSGMVLLATPHPELTSIFKEVIGLRADVAAVEYNLGGSLGARQPDCVDTHTPSCPTDPTCCDEVWPDLQITFPAPPAAPWPPTPPGQYPAFGVPNDPYFIYQWGMANTGQQMVDRSHPAHARQTKNRIIGLDMGILDAWRRTTGSPNVAVAVLDTGIEYCNPDFDPDRFIQDDIALVCPGNALDSYPCCPGGDCRFPSAGDNRGHGTVIAGLIGAKANNNLGIAGIDQQCKLLSATTVGHSSGPGPQLGRTIIALEEIATLSKYDSVRVINMSTGQICEPSPHFVSDALRNVVAVLHAQNRFVVTIAGNGGVGFADYWCPNNFSNVFTVGGVDSQGWRFSSNGGLWESGTGASLDFMAPGWAMLSTVCQSDACQLLYSPQPCPYASYRCAEYQHNFTCGTSWAAPMVAATISLILARAEFLQINEGFAQIDFDEMKEILRLSCYGPDPEVPSSDPLDTPGWNEYYGHGIVHAHRAMLALERGHYFCRADRTTNNTPGTPGYGVPDGHITSDDLDSFEERFLLDDLEACDVTQTDCESLDPQEDCGHPDGVLDESD